MEVSGVVAGQVWGGRAGAASPKKRRPAAARLGSSFVPLDRVRVSSAAPPSATRGRPRLVSTTNSFGFPQGSTTIYCLIRWRLRRAARRGVVVRVVVIKLETHATNSHATPPGERYAAARKLEAGQRKQRQPCWAACHVLPNAWQSYLGGRGRVEEFAGRSNFCCAFPTSHCVRGGSGGGSAVDARASRCEQRPSAVPWWGAGMRAPFLGLLGRAVPAVRHPSIH